jgi:prophage antirepressor-like protein
MSIVKSNTSAFIFQSHQLTVITEKDGEVWFIAKEVAEILGYSDAQAMTRRLDTDEVSNRQIVGFGNRGINLINEPGLYSSIIGSNKPTNQTRNLNLKSLK